MGRGRIIYSRNPGHMTKMAATPIYGKNPSKIKLCGFGFSIGKNENSGFV